MLAPTLPNTTIPASFMPTSPKPKCLTMLTQPSHAKISHTNHPSQTLPHCNILSFPFQLLLAGNRKMPIYIDKYAHATFVFGCRAAGRNDMMYFKHNSPEDLLKHIQDHGPGENCAIKQECFGAINLISLQYEVHFF